MAEAVPGALENLILNFGPNSVMTFAHGSSVVRAALAVSEAEAGITIAPLRGAMPIVWAADGLPEVEQSSGADFLEAPIGTFQYDTDGLAKETSPLPPQKAEIIRGILNRAIEVDGRDPARTSITVLDEVQQGGTLGLAATIARRVGRSFNFASPIRVIAAQDSRTKVAKQSKSPVYTSMASNRAWRVLRLQLFLWPLLLLTEHQCSIL